MNGDILEDQPHKHGDIVRISPDASEDCRPGETAWIVAIISDRVRFPLPEMPEGTIYSVEFEDGSAIDINEHLLKKT